MSTYHYKAIYKFFAFLQDKFDLHSATLELKPDLIFPSSSKSTAYHTAFGLCRRNTDGSAHIQLNTKNLTRRRGALFILGHEFYHAVQFRDGFIPGRNIDWQKEIEANTEGTKLMIEFLQKEYPRSIRSYDKIEM